MAAPTQRAHDGLVGGSDPRLFRRHRLVAALSATCQSARLTFLKCSPAGRHILIGVWPVPDSDLTDVLPDRTPINTEGRSSTVNNKQIEVYGGINTHAATHHIAMIDTADRRLTDVQVPTTAAGYRAVLQFPGVVERAGMRGNRVHRLIWGRGDTRRPGRGNSGGRGQPVRSQTSGQARFFDAYSAAEAAPSGRATAAPKGGEGLRRVTAAAPHVQVLGIIGQGGDDHSDQGHARHRTEQLRARYGGVSNTKVIAVLAETRPTTAPVTADEATAYSLRLLARS